MLPNLTFKLAKLSLGLFLALTAFTLGAQNVAITQTMTVVEIQTTITNALASNSTVTVTGSKTTGVTTSLIITLSGQTITWQAEYGGSTSGNQALIELYGSGTFEIDGGKITQSGLSAAVRGNDATLEINVRPNSVIRCQGNNESAGIANNGSTTITGGLIENTSLNGAGVFVLSDLTITGGEIKTTGDYFGINILGIAAANITISGGQISATNGVAIQMSGDNKTIIISSGTISNNSNTRPAVRLELNTGNSLIFVNGGSISNGGTGGKFSFGAVGTSLVVEWDGAGTAFDLGTSTGLTVTGAGTPTATWNIVGGKHGISYASGGNTGFLEIPGVTVIIIPPTITSSNNYSLTYSTSGLITIAATTAGGTHNFTVTASNGILPNATQNFTLTATTPANPVVINDTMTAAQIIAEIESSLNYHGTITVTGSRMVGGDIRFAIPAGSKVIWLADMDVYSSSFLPAIRLTSGTGEFEIGAGCVIESKTTNVPAVFSEGPAVILNGGTIRNNSAGSTRAIETLNGVVVALISGTLEATSGTGMALQTVVSLGSANVTVTGNVTINGRINTNVTIASTGTLTVPNGGTMTVMTTRTITNNGKIDNTGTGTIVVDSGGAITNVGAGEIIKKSQAAVTISGLNATYEIGNTATASATGGTLGGAFTWTSSNTGVATINASTGAVSFVGYGTTTITATKPGDLYNYNDAVGTFNITVTPIGLYVNGGALLTTVAGIKAAIENASGTVTVTGTMMGVTSQLSLTLTGQHVKWQAEFGGNCTTNFVLISGNGVFEVDGGKITNSLMRAIYQDGNVSIIITDGLVESTANNGHAIATFADLTITGGVVRATGSGINAIAVDVIGSGNELLVSGGTISGNRAISISSSGGRAFITGGVISGNSTVGTIWVNNAIVDNCLVFVKSGAGGATITNSGSGGRIEVSSFDNIAIEWNGTGSAFVQGSNTGLTVSGAGTPTATWDIVGGKHGISYASGTNTGFIEVTGVTVNPSATAPAITSADNTTLTYGTAGTFQVTATGTPTITYSLTGAPTGVSINTTSGLITIAGTTAAGAHTFTITASNGVTPNATQNFTLTVNKLTPTTSNLSYSLASVTYNGSARPVNVTAASGVTGLGATITVKYDGSTTAPTNAGTYAITVDIAEGTNYAASPGLSLGNFTIGKATHYDGVAIHGVPQEVDVLINNAQTRNFDLTSLLPNVAPLSLGTPITYFIGTTTGLMGIVGTISYTSGNTLSIPILSYPTDGHTAQIPVTITTGNFVNFIVNITVKTVAKTPVTINGITMAGGEYRGTAYNYTGSAVITNANNGQTVTGITLTVEYNGISGTVYGPSPTAPINAGDYELTLSVPASNATYTGFRNYDYHIARKVVSIKADDKQIAQLGAAIPTFTATPTGFIPPDSVASLGITLSITCPTGNNNAVGTYPIVITGPSTSTNYTFTYVNGTLTVDKANPTVNWPTGLTATYGQTLANISLPGNGSGTSGTFTWATGNATSVGNVGTQNHNMTFTPTATNNYNTVTQSVAVTVNKANPTVNWPTGLTATYGQTLANISLPGNGSGTSGTFTWATGNATSVGNVGTQNHNMTFTPTATNNYNTVTQSVAVTVDKANPTVNWPTGLTATYGQHLSDILLPGNGTATNPNSSANVPGTFAWVSTPATTYVGDVGTQYHSMTFTPANTNNYNTTPAAQSVSVSVGKRTMNPALYAGILHLEPVLINQAARDYTYDLGHLLPHEEPLTLGTPITYTLGTINDTSAILSGTPVITGSSISLPVAALTGAHLGLESTIQVTISSPNYLDFSPTITVRAIGKTPVTITANMSGGEYRGTPYAYSGTPTVINGTTLLPITGLQLEYLYIGIGTTVYNSTVAPKDAGTYELIIKVPDSNPTYAGQEDIAFTIARKVVSIKADDKQIAQLGAAIPTFTATPTGFIPPDSVASLGITLSITCPTGNNNAVGTYPIVITGPSTSTNYAFTYVNGTLTVNGTFTVTVNGSYATTDQSGAGDYAPGATVTIRAGSHSGYTFIGWTVNSGDVTLANRNNATTTFTMPLNAVTVTANWSQITYQVTVQNGSGSGSFAPNATVSIWANTPQEGFKFKNWTTTSSGVIFANANSANTTFGMPDYAVTVTANFERTEVEIEVEIDEAEKAVGAHYFAPINLKGADYRYEIVQRPDTLGGRGVTINKFGQFVFAEHLMPLNIPRTGTYVINCIDINTGQIVDVYRVVVK